MEHSQIKLKLKQNETREKKKQNDDTLRYDAYSYIITPLKNLHNHQSSS